MSSLSLVASLAAFTTWEPPLLQGSQCCSSSPPGEQTPPHDHVCLSDEVNHQNSTTSTKDRGTSTESPCRRTAATQMAPACVTSSRPPEKHQATSRPPPHGASVVVVTSRGPEAHRDRIRYQTDVRLEATEEIYLTPVQKNSDPLETDKPFLSQSSENRMSISSDIDTSGYSALAGKTNPSISEEDEVLDYMSSPDKTNLPRASCGGGSGGSRPGRSLQRASVSSDTSALSYDSVKYTLVVDENVQLELVSLKQCYSGYSDESDSATVYDNCVSSPYESAIGEEYEEDALKRDSVCLSEDSTPEADIHFSKKFLNVFMSGRARSSSECWAPGGGGLVAAAWAALRVPGTSLRACSVDGNPPADTSRSSACHRLWLFPWWRGRRGGTWKSLASCRQRWPEPFQAAFLVSLRCGRAEEEAGWSCRGTASLLQCLTLPRA